MDSEKTIENPSEYSALGRLLDKIRMALLPETRVSDPVEQAAIDLERHLIVLTMPRSYLMSVSYTAKSPEQAALVANTFAREYLKAKFLQSIRKKAANARQEVLRLSSVYGNKHPLLAAAQAHLDVLENEERNENERQGLEVPFPPLGAAFTPALVNQTPSSPRGLSAFALALGGSRLPVSGWLIGRIERIPASGRPQRSWPSRNYLAWV